MHDVVVFAFPLSPEFWSANLFIEVGSDLYCGWIIYRFGIFICFVAVYLRTAFFFTSAFANFAIVDGGLYCLLVVLLVVGVIFMNI